MKIGVQKGTKRGPYKRSQRKKEIQNIEASDGMSYEEIAQVLGITPGDVKRIEEQAMNKLRKPSKQNKSLHKYHSIKLSEADQNLEN